MIPGGSKCECLQGQAHMRYMKLCIEMLYFWVLALEIPCCFGEVLTVTLRNPATCMNFVSFFPKEVLTDCPVV